MTRPLVSILTPTWQRPELLSGCIENVRAQTYRPVEHIVVMDGPDFDARWMGQDSAQICHRAEQLNTDDYRIESSMLGRNWSTYLPASFVAAPVTVAMLVASGEYQMWLADDERMTPDHVASLVEALEAGGADFAYSQVEMRWHDNRTSPWVIGTDPPREGQITNALYRTDLLKRGLYPFGAGMTSDWACITRWMDAGAVWAYVPRVTLTHRVDH